MFLVDCGSMSLRAAAAELAVVLLLLLLLFADGLFEVSLRLSVIFLLKQEKQAQFYP